MSDLSTVQLPPLPPGEEPPHELPPDAEPPAPRPPRRWVRVALLAVLAVILVAAPLTLYLVLHEDSTGTGGSGGGGVVPTQAPTTSGAPTGGPTATAGAPVPDGRIPSDVLRNATIDVPAWPTDNLTGISGRVTFHNGEVLVPADGRFDFERHMLIGAVTYGDVDRDGATETVLEIGCYVQGGSTQLVALDRDRKGTIITLGTVVATTGEIRVIDTEKTRVTGDGVVEARVGDFQRCCGDETPVIWQTRGYAWNGTRFRQTSGPVSFPLNPSVTETTLSFGDLALGPAIDGVRHGVLPVRVTYVRGTRPHHLVLSMSPAPGFEREGSTWPTVRSDRGWPIVVDLPCPAAGVTATYTFAFRRPAASTGGDFTIDLHGADAAGTVLSESNPFGGGGLVTVRTSD